MKTKKIIATVTIVCSQIVEYESEAELDAAKDDFNVEMYLDAGEFGIGGSANFTIEDRDVVIRS